MRRGVVAGLVLAVVFALFSMGVVVALRIVPHELQRSPGANADRNPPTDPAAGTLQAPPLTERETDAPREPERRVRFVEKNGVVSVRPDAPLVRADPPKPETPDAEPEGPKPDVYRLVVIEGNGIIDARDTLISLAHVDPPDADHICRDENGAGWPCGRRARTALRRLVRRRAIACLPLHPDAMPSTRNEPVEARCEVAGTDLSRWMVEQGWASPSQNAPEAWTALHAAARDDGRGLYAKTGR